MDAILLKYRSTDHDYLIYDTHKNSSDLDAHAVRAICSYNCGLGSSAIVAGPFKNNEGNLTVKIFAPDGEERPMDRDAMNTGFCFLLDAGYLSGKNREEYEARPVGKVFLSEDVLENIFSGSHA